MDVLGNYKSVISARAADKDIQKKAQDGGIVTTLFAYALEEGIIDGAIVAGPSDEPWKPEPMVVTTKAELLAAAGTRYTISPNLQLIKEATRSYGLDRVGIVGTPCQVQATRKAQLYPIGMRDVDDKIALVLGIYCMENLSYQALEAIVEDHCNQKMESVKKMDIGKGKFTVYTERGAVSQMPLKYIHKYVQPGCHVCLDYVANLADISTGSVGSPDGWSTVFVRSNKGNAVWDGAMAAGLFETKDMEGVKPGLDLVKKLATEKITKNQKHVDERKSFGLKADGTPKALRNPYETP
ncbi:coenzyme F420 hydrogenase subunit beta [Methanoculleus sp. FWC-SCC1]|uniref:Coenzyme F420 hydrogenase subunit beta n=1 Tax=Methanoculleus frigidifontis TaxID=2584085 RepID=A0ABT8MAQ5_9EURY|nr:coenzyme F420 hydrogenase subunit beta [Methanoculleus sp. FWC-SCC1]MDN7024961.1 coenzyme F420 hydrogenase subunit beta [Methanoculleus sp. FWC-SCC1]